MPSPLNTSVKQLRTGTVPVMVTQHPVDWDCLSADVASRWLKALNQEKDHVFYLNPMFTVESSGLSAEFLKKARHAQASWCRIITKTIGRRSCRKVSSWNCNGEYTKEKLPRFLNRAMCFTGVLCCEGQFIPSHEWPDRVPKTA